MTPGQEIRDLIFIPGLPSISSETEKVTVSPRKADYMIPKLPFTSNNSSDLSNSGKTIP